MTKIHRLLLVLTGLVITEFLSVPTSSGQPRTKDLLGVSSSPVAVDEALAASKFAETALLTYKTLEGETLFALQVKPDLKAPPRRPRDYVIMVSSAATQGGEGWIASQQIAQEIIAKADDTDRIALWAFSTPDNKATFSLTRGLVSPRGDAKNLADALQELKVKNYPSGDTDLKHALRKALSSFDGKEGRQRIVLFLGDGLSTHNPLVAADRQALCKEMVERQIAFFPVPLGVQLSPENLHGLATGTGGAVLRTRVL